MDSFLRKADEVTRRHFMSKTAQSLLGVGLLQLTTGNRLFGADEAAATAAPAKKKRCAKNVIYLYMGGGMTHLDTFDPKPGTEWGGPVSPIRTTGDGVLISEYLPTLAKHMDKVAVVRSLSSTQGAHAQGSYLMHTSYNPRGTIKHPGLGAWLQRLDGKRNSTLPSSVRIGGGGAGGAGFMESKYDPLVLGNPNEGLKNSKRPDAVPEKLYEERLSLAQEFDSAFHKTYDQKIVRAQKDMYDDAMKLMKSEDLKAFDLSLESAEAREAYGNNGFGQGCLLARRLIENDVRFVEVSLGGWDTHSNNFAAVQGRAGTLDQALSTLLNDLDMRGMLDETMVVLATEFGRTPDINQNDGRDHYPKAFSGFIAGAGVAGGQAYGVTDEAGKNVIENGVQVPDFNATIAYNLGLPLDHVIHSPSKRPFTVAHKGRPVMDILA